MFVFSPLASAIAATDTPGCRQAAMTCSLNSGLCLRLVLLGAAFTTIVSMCPPKIRGHYPHISSLSRWHSRTHTMQAHPKPFILGVAKLLFNSHALGVERDNCHRAEVGESGRACKQPGFPLPLSSHERHLGNAALPETRPRDSSLRRALDQHHPASRWM